MSAWSVAVRPLIFALFVGCTSAPLASPSVPVSSATATPSSATAAWREIAAPKGAAPGGQWIGIPTYDGKTISGLVQSPAGASQAPVVVVLHGDGGLRPRHLEWAASFTRSGFITLTPCWQAFSDRGDTEPLGCAADAPQRDSAENVAKDITALVTAARALPRADTAHVAIIGHSAGGSAAILSGSLGTRADAIVAMSAAYGQGTGTGSIKARWGTSVPEQIDGLKPPLLIVHGTNDQQGAGTRIDVARGYEKLVRDAGKTVEAIYVDGAPHDFPLLSAFWTDDLRGKVVTFLRKYLGG